MTVFPTIHLNGTSKEELLEKYITAQEAVQTAIDAVMNTYPHARDYYVISSEAVKRSYEEYKERIIKLEQIRSELEAIVTHLDKV